ncbi:Hypothetical predicted protein [Olea europaea subsp. europaea]|uniref:Uncharacterized protein n=1 Tax=Olea europaea subsp. europaea TaxID=158383 RepID=A0A8S0SNI5_OLEEU|nr:Hypothetical predicted protein [Olea europaea subsp. europaea]
MRAHEWCLSVVLVKDAGTLRQRVVHADANRRHTRHAKGYLMHPNSVFVPPHLGIEKKSCFKDHGHYSLSVFQDKENFDWEEQKERDKSKRQRAESQWIVAIRPLYRLQYPVTYLSRLQRILPVLRWKLYFKAANVARLLRGLGQRHIPLEAVRPLL